MFEDMSKAELIQKIILLEKENKELKELVYGKSEEEKADMPKQEVNISNNKKVKIFMNIFYSNIKYLSIYLLFNQRMFHPSI